MSDLGLTFVEAPPVPEHVNVLAYGPPGAGKSTFAATSPGPILWVNAEGPGALAYARKTAAQRGTEILEVRLDESQPVRDVLREVIRYVRSTPEGQPRPSTVVVDTIGKVRDLLIAQIVKPGSSQSLRQFGQVADVVGRFVAALRDLPVNLVLIAHEDVADAEGGDRIVRPLIGGKLTEQIPGEVDIVTYCGVARDEQGRARYMGQLVEARGRRAKDRSGALGEVRDLDLSEWIAVYRAALMPDESDVPWGGEEGEAA